MSDQPGDLDRAFWMTRSVGRSIGLNFSDAMEEGRLEPDRYAALITTCRFCPNEGRCQQWLGQSGGARSKTRAPEFCPNAEALQALKKH